MRATQVSQSLALLMRLAFASIASLVVSKRGYDKRSLSLSGAVCAVFVGFVTTASSLSFFACLLTFFVTSSLLTKWKAERKKLLDAEYKEGGQRNVKQVLCNGGITVVVALFYIIEVGCTERPVNFAKDFTASLCITSLVGSLACCNGDTWSSEVGTAVGSLTPRLITTFRKVPAGTNGAVTIVGLMASALGGLVIGIAYVTVTFLSLSSLDFTPDYPPQWPLLALATVAGVVGSALDSVLGALLQYSGFCALRKKVVNKPFASAKHISGSDILDNDQVNFLSSLGMSLVTPYIGYCMWEALES